MITYATFLALLDNPPSTTAGSEFLTLDTLFQASGATTAVFTLTSVSRALFPKLPAKWVAAVFSVLLMLLKIQYEQNMHFDAPTIFLSIVNAAIVYAAAVGINNITTAPAQQGAGGAPAAPSAPTKSFRWWA